jgi:gas vesicle structural protein
MPEQGSGYLARPAPSGLADVVDTILDKGLVVDAYVRVSLLGIELLTVDARLVVASVDTYLRFAEATNRLDLSEKFETPVDLLTEGTEEAVRGVASRVVEHKIEGMVEDVEDAVGGVVDKVTDTARDAAHRVEDLAEDVVHKVRHDDE